MLIRDFQTLQLNSGTRAFQSPGRQGSQLGGTDADQLPNILRSTPRGFSRLL